MSRLNVFFGTLACVVLLPIGANAESNSSRLNKERLEVGRALLEVTSSNVESIFPYYADDIEYHDPIVDIYGIDEMELFLKTLFTYSFDLITTVEDEISIDDIYTGTWTMVGSFVGVPYEAKGMSIIKFREKSMSVYYQRDYYSEGDIMLGIPGLDSVLCGFRGFYRSLIDPIISEPYADCKDVPPPPPPP